MKSIELGDYDTFSGLLSLFTAVIGLAYPFILQAIERIQERYITERVSHWFEEETTFARFFFMLNWGHILQRQNIMSQIRRFFLQSHIIQQVNRI